MTSLHDLLAAYETSRQRQRPTGLTASGAQPYCDRQTAYRLQDVPISDEREPVTAATVGTMLHETYARLWAEHDPDALIEISGPHGTADVVRPHRREVRDLKTVAPHAFDRWARNGGPDQRVWQQVAIYAADHGATTGWTLTIDALDRQDGRCATYTTRYDPAQGQQAVKDLQALNDHLTTIPPHQAEPTGLDAAPWVCQRCPWTTTCGDAPTPEPLENTSPEALDAVTEYLAAREAESDAKRRKNTARRALQGIQGQVGGWVLAWTTRTVQGGYREGYETTTLTVKKAKP